MVGLLLSVCQVSRHLGRKQRSVDDIFPVSPWLFATPCLYAGPRTSKNAWSSLQRPVLYCLLMHGFVTSCATSISPKMLQCYFLWTILPRSSHFRIRRLSSCSSHSNNDWRTGSLKLQSLTSHKVSTVLAEQDLSMVLRFIF